MKIESFYNGRIEADVMGSVIVRSIVRSMLDRGRQDVVLMDIGTFQMRVGCRVQTTRAFI